MSKRFRDELDPTTADSLEAIDAPPPPGAAQVAQQRLLDRMQGTARPTRPARVGWLAVATTAVLAMVVVALPMLLDQGRAFAAVQAHFRDFTTLSMHVEQRVGGRVVQTSRMVVDDRGVLRTDVGDQLSVVVDPVRGRLLMLQHGPRQAVSMPLQQATSRPGASLDWLAGIRDFKGRARKLEDTRVIDGRTANGWVLDVAGSRLVLWADRQGVPLALETGAAGGLEIHYAFEFDTELEPGYLSSDIPRGYRIVAGDEA